MRQAVTHQHPPQPPASRARIKLQDRILLGIACYFVLALVLRVAIAQPLDEVAGGTLWMDVGDGEWVEAPTLDTHLEARVVGLMAVVEVQQRFRNHTPHWIEATYAFPLPDDAAVNRLVLEVAGRRIEGLIQEKEQAVKTYQAARDAGQTASLVTQQRPNLFTTRAANIGPGEEISVNIHYVQQLGYRDGQFSLRFPTTITPRYDGQAEGAQAGLYDHEVEPDMTQAQVAGGGPSDPWVSLRIHLQAGFDLVRLESRYHDIEIADSNGLYMIELADGAVPADRDFELVWEPALKSTPQAALFSEDHGDHQYALLMVMPPHPEQPVELPRELIFVIDTSGSMQGQSLVQAKESLAMAIGSLRTEDRFNLIEFNSQAHPLFEGAVPADASALVSADNWVRGLSANGGTNMAPALELALRGETPEGFVRQVVFVTDGSVGNEVELFALIESRLGDARLFTVGIGSAPNAYFMRKAAQFGRGSFTLIGDAAEVAEKMDALLSRLEQPALTDICVDWPAYAEFYPAQLPDLYVGEPLFISARLESLKGEVEICGQNVLGSWNEWMSLKAGEPGSGIGTLWARRKISGLMDDLALGNDADLIREQVVDVALAHRLVSRYTAFVAVDQTPARSREAALARARIPNPAPHSGASLTEPMALALPQTATDAPLRMLFGLMLLGLAWIFTLRLRDDSL